MAKNNNLKFKKNESFYIRDGWFDKAINTIYESEENIFAKNNGIINLGIGANMVKGLRYWLRASGIISSLPNKTELTALGNLIIKYDRYFEDDFTWFLIHYQLCTNKIDCPIFYGIFNSNFKSFKKSELTRYLCDIYEDDGFSVKEEYVEEDLNVLLKSYISDDKITNPEDNYVCPLSTLKLLAKQKDLIIKNKPKYNQLSYLIVYYSLACLYDYKPFQIEESYDEKFSPCLLFNLDRNLYLQYLEEMKKNGLFTINKTAGLNTVYFEKNFCLEDIFKLKFGGE